jgi:hypothetical protein
MMYLVTPTQLLWTNLAHLSPEKIIEMGGSLEAISDWQPTERSLAPVDIRVAVRYGIPVSRGIVVDAMWILDQHRPRELWEAHERARIAGQHPQIQATDEFIDKNWAPGWKQEGDELNHRIAEDSARSVREAQEEADRQLEVPVKPELADHWHSLGGHLFE